jgi:hypothetical protein
MYKPCTSLGPAQALYIVTLYEWELAQGAKQGFRKLSANPLRSGSAEYLRLPGLGRQRKPLLINGLDLPLSITAHSQEPAEDLLKH